MLRWCQSTRRILDVYGRTLKAQPWQRAAPTRGQPIIQTRQKTTGSRSPGTTANDTPPHIDLASAEPSSQKTVSREKTRPIPSEASRRSARGNVLPPTSKDLKNPGVGKRSATITRSDAQQSAVRTSEAKPRDSLPKDQTASEAARALEAVLYTPNPRDRSISSLLHEYRKYTTQFPLQHLRRSLYSDLVSTCGGLCLALVYSPQNADSCLIEALFGRDAPPLVDLAKFVAGVGRDMDRLAFTGSGDMFWLKQVKGAVGAAKSSQKPSEQALLDAIRSEYQEHLNDPTMTESHIAYVSFLLSVNRPEFADEAVNAFASTLEITPNPSTRHSGIFWYLLSSRDVGLSDAARERVCDVVLGLVKSSATQPSLPSDPEVVQARGISAITQAFSATLFPHTCHLEDSLRSWAHSQALEVLSPTLPVETRWQNLTLLSTTMSRAPPTTSSGARSTAAASNTMWRTTLMLDTVLHMLDTSQSAQTGPATNAQPICRNLWALFKAESDSNSDLPGEVTRACMSAFLHLAAITKDDDLFIQTSNFCRQHQLWKFDASSSPEARRQTVEVVVAFSVALRAWNRLEWPGLFSMLRQAFGDGVEWQPDVFSALLRYHAQRDVEVAYNLYRFCGRFGIGLQEQDHTPLALALIKAEHWEAVLEFLDSERLDRQGVETIVVALMRYFQENRLETADPEIMSTLAHIVPRLYRRSPPPPHLKYPLRYFLSMLIWTGHAEPAVILAAQLKMSSKDFFSPHLIRRLVLQLISKRQFHYAVKLHDMFRFTRDRKFARTVDHVRRKLGHKLVEAGSFGIFRQLPKPREGRVRLRQRLVRISVDRRRDGAQLSSSDLSPFLRNVPLDGATVREAVTILAKSGRLYAARKLYMRHRDILDAKTSTAIGNAILHAPMDGGSLRVGKLVRNILDLKALLVKYCDFVPDRATSNILLKAMLRWEKMFDATRVRQLFDNMVRDGYPVPDHWRRQPHNVPFNTVTPPGEGIDMPVSEVINFNRHTKPMYKLFIKAFYLRRDVAAAKTVIGILKEVQADVLAEREKRNRARREGIVKKRLKEERKAKEEQEKRP